MTVKELRDLCDQCIKEQGEDCPVVIADDANSHIFHIFEVTDGEPDSISREVTPTKRKMVRVLWKPNSGIKNIPCAHCTKCKNFIKGSRKHDTPFTTISCNNPRLGKVIDDVIEYKCTECMDYDPCEPVYVNEEVIDVPGTYRIEKVLLLKANTKKEVK